MVHHSWSVQGHGQQSSARTGKSGDLMMMMMTLRVAAYVFALLAMAITLPLTIGAGQQGIVVAVLGGTLAVTPYVLVRAIEELTGESVQEGNLR
jgi:hypothetical protein